MSTETKTAQGGTKAAAESETAENPETAETAVEPGEEKQAAPEKAAADSGTEADTEADAVSDGDADDFEDAEDSDSETEAVSQDKSYGVGQGAAAVIAAGLGVVSLTGSWVGTVAAARSNLVGQLETAQTAGVAQQIQALYGNQWHLTALIGGAFALLAVVVGVVVLARPSFGTPGRVQAPWIKSVAWAGVGLGAIGLLLAVAKYTDLILGLPSAS
ncbi:hypothetical protein RCO28_05505 [Streptomyces sp. LHD-70]|uniref:hypothetical protein n=1 Tax=Streptomyces sp. LHD-70 TaxID=3072140 RepID=UPI00280CB825|nr:hypothetical protein [Streptomyces sp. LHD-70]MDQ8701946.1 hypothetical protein [Streptomyces sp. LHD-70]